MAWLNSTARYGTLSLALHWLTALLIVAVYALMHVHEALGRTPAAATAELWHSMLGLLVLLLTLIRLPLRFMQPAPAIEPPLVQWQHWLSLATHGALYVLILLAMPILGWLLLSAEGHDISFFGLPLPALSARDPARAETVKEIHETIGNIGYALIALHTAAALYHHYVLRDNTLVRMLLKRN
ncbi:MAG: cytochrome b [Pseudomonadales bacterium]|jgi:cytochrome b561|nr:cytochrome b [Pseudomonadales bacterium]